MSTTADVSGAQRKCLACASLNAELDEYELELAELTVQNARLVAECDRLRSLDDDRALDGVQMVGALVGLLALVGVVLWFVGRLAAAIGGGS